MTDRDLFIAALGHSDPADRAAWLDHACAADPDRRRRVEVLLRAHDQASRFLADPARSPEDSVVPDDPTRTAHPSDDTSPATAVDVAAFLNPTGKPGLLGTLDRYEVIEVVGQGGMGVVLKAFDPKLHRLVALKLMAPHLAAHGSARKRFEREAKAVAAVRNEHVVAIHEVQTDGPTPYLVMEFVGGVSLQERLDRRGPADVKEVLRIGTQVATGLAAAHKYGVVHRDIKPANILLENGVERVKLTDFGLARTADDASLTQSGVITGTPNYMSPEQAAGGTTDARSDLFSLGSVLYALCTGHPPFRAETPLAVMRRVCDDPVRPPREVNPDVPDWLDAIVRKLLAKAPGDRFQTAAEVADLMGRHLAHLQQPAAIPMPSPVDLPGGTGPGAVLRVRATGDGRVVSWRHFSEGRLVEPNWLERTIGLTMPLTDVVTDLIALAGSLDPGYRLEVVRANGPTTANFDVRLAGAGFEIECGRRLARTEVAAQPLAGVFGENFHVVVSVNAGSADVRAAVLGLLRSKYPEAADAPVSGAPGIARRPDAPPPARSGCAIGLVLVVGLGLLVGFRDTFMDRFFRSGLWAPVYMVGVSAFMVLVMGWGRRQSKRRWERRLWESGLVIVVGGTLAALLAAWEDQSHGGRLSRALNWHTGGLIASCLIVNLSYLPALARWAWTRERAGPAAPVGPAPARDVVTAHVLKAGIVVLVAGLALTGLYVTFATGRDKAEGLAGLLAGWGLIALLVFGPGVGLSRRHWRRQYGPDPRGDRRAAVRAGLGIAATVAAIALAVSRNPDLRHQLVDRRPEARLSVHWDRAAVDRVIVERDGLTYQEFDAARGGVGLDLPLGSYLVRAVKGSHEVYREEVALTAAGHGVSIFEAPLTGSHYGLLTVTCSDPTVTVTLTGPTQSVVMNDPGTPSQLRQPLWPPTEYRLTVSRAGKEVHSEPITMKAGEERHLSIPRIVDPEPKATVYLRPKTGSFPTDVVRMQLSPDGSAVAAERFAGPILVFDAATGKERFTVPRPQTHCTAFGFTPDGKRLAYIAPADGPDHVLRTVDAVDGRPVGNDLRPRAGLSFFNAHVLAFTPDGKRLAVSSAHNANPDNRWVSRVLRWELAPDAQSPRELDPMEWQEGTIEVLRFTPNGAEVLAVCGTHTWTAWAWDSGTPARRNEAEVDFTYDLLAVGGPVEAVAGFGQLTKRPVVLFSQPWPDGKVFMAGVDAGPIRFGSLAVSADGKLAAVGVKGTVAARWEEQPVVRVWDTGTRKPLAELRGHTDWALDIAFDRAGLVTAGKDGLVLRWRLP